MDPYRICRDLRLGYADHINAARATELLDRAGQTGDLPYADRDAALRSATYAIDAVGDLEAVRRLNVYRDDVRRLLATLRMAYDL